MFWERKQEEKKTRQEVCGYCGGAGKITYVNIEEGEEFNCSECGGSGYVEVEEE